MKKSPTIAAPSLVGAAITLALVLPRIALAADQVHDEIQVYNAEIADVGQWTIQQHLNYAVRGQQQSEIPGGFTSNHALQGTPEFAYGIADWWEVGFYMPFAAESGPVTVQWRQNPKLIRRPRRCQTQLLLWYQLRA